MLYNMILNVKWYYTVFKFHLSIEQFLSDFLFIQFPCQSGSIRPQMDAGIEISARFCSVFCFKFYVLLYNSGLCVFCLCNF